MFAAALAMTAAVRTLPRFPQVVSDWWAIRNDKVIASGTFWNLFGSGLASGLPDAVLLVIAATGAPGGGSRHKYSWTLRACESKMAPHATSCKVMQLWYGSVPELQSVLIC